VPPADAVALSAAMIEAVEGSERRRRRCRRTACNGFSRSMGSRHVRHQRLLESRQGTSADEALLRQMTDAIAHRVRTGAATSSTVGRARAPAPGDHRPLAGWRAADAERGRHRDVTFNGEIYNYIGLREELIAKGHVFRSRCDTEVLVHGYEEWGDALPERLGGMFAFAIWTRAASACSSRATGWARAGLLPPRRDRLLFGSEIKSLLCDPAVPRQLDDEALDLYSAPATCPRR